MPFDAVVVGGGPGGYVCAIRAAQLGGKVALVERAKLGGTCTNTGCIPTKALLASAELAEKIGRAKAFGINATASVDFAATMKRASAIAASLSKGVELLLQSNGVEIIQGTGVIKSRNTVAAAGRQLQTNNIVIATGSLPTELPFARFGGNILSSETIWSLSEKPESIAVIGGGVEGVEFACAFSALGVKTTVIEMADSILPFEDAEASQLLFNSLKRAGVHFVLGKRVEKIDGETIIAGGEKVEAEKILVAIGRKPDIDEASLRAVGVAFDGRGIKTNARMQTNIPNIYAIGDAAGGRLAHEASAQGVVAAENIMGEQTTFDSVVLPACIFTQPEIARVGKTEEKTGVLVGRFPFAASSKAACIGEKMGFVKVFIKKSVLCGALIVGAHASELIAEAALAIKLKAKAEDVASTIHAHPTLPEAFKEAVEDALGRTIHLPGTKQKQPEE
ncbi:MAG: dihydrolipoyl dehydrogenase [Candidatus Micrarchaeia archaeon]